jgi:hypothetical protein
VGGYEESRPGLLPGGIDLPSVLDRTGRSESVMGNDRRDFSDVVALFSNPGWCSTYEPIAFDLEWTV